MINYKKAGMLVLAASTLILAGCGNSSTNMTFEDTYNAFLTDHSSNMIEMFNKVSKAPAIAEKGNYTLSGSATGGINANISISADSKVASQTVDTDSSIVLSGTLTQEGQDDVISLDSSILYKLVGGHPYINLSNLSLKSAKGNPQISMIGAFSSIITNKWISLTSSGMDESAALQGLNLSNVYALPEVIINSLKNHPIFTQTSKEMVDGNPVFHIALSSDGLYLVAKDIVTNDTVKKFLKDTTFTDEDLQNWAKTFVANAAFDGTLTALAKNNILLTINKLNLDETAMMKGSIAEDKTHFDFIDTTTADMSTVATFDMEQKGKDITFAIASPTNSLHIQGTMDPKISNSSFGGALTLVVTHPEFNFTFKGETSSEQIDAITIEAPTSFKTIDEIVNGLGGLVGGMGGSADEAMSGDDIPMSGMTISQ